MATMTEEIMGLVDALIRRYDKGSFIEYRDARAAVLARIEALVGQRDHYWATCRRAREGLSAIIGGLGVGYTDASERLAGTLYRDLSAALAPTLAPVEFVPPPIEAVRRALDELDRELKEKYEADRRRQKVGLSELRYMVIGVPGEGSE